MATNAGMKAIAKEEKRLENGEIYEEVRQLMSKDLDLIKCQS